MNDNYERANEAQADSQSAAAPSPKRGKRKLAIIGGIVAVIVVAAAGFWVWHNDPSFCNAFCHASMDPYVESYNVEDNTKAVDKWGNDVSNSHAMLVVSHKNHDLACLDCHVPSLGQQVHEVVETITGDYAVPLEEVSGLNLLLNAGKDSASGRGDEFCLRAGCHDVTRQDLTKLTEGRFDLNPHSWAHEMNACTDCHKSHRASVMACTECHANTAKDMPDGWVTYAQSQDVLASIYA